ncbi:MAG TPA: nucleotidyl transferase AbiEii/AbiGii toxin family protein [Polyangiaceae bacterium]|nr:nucleotidyl transferase AbiEii/AbiGii toxin family protein [Polyangiaceae bacterium]
MKIELSRDWTEFLSVLIARRVRFVLVGGHAVAGHGEPRLTEDLDLFVEPTTANAKRLREALEDFGFGAVAPDVEELATPDKIFMLGRKPWRIDILTPRAPHLRPARATSGARRRAVEPHGAIVRIASRPVRAGTYSQRVSTRRRRADAMPFGRSRERERRTSFHPVRG